MIDYGLKNKVALITGANNPWGIGATTAMAFAREGAKVVLVYCMLPKAKEITYMAKITIEELFYGDKYGVMGEVVKQVFAR